MALTYIFANTLFQTTAFNDVLDSLSSVVDVGIATAVAVHAYRAVASRNRRRRKILNILRKNGGNFGVGRAVHGS